MPRRKRKQSKQPISDNTLYLLLAGLIGFAFLQDEQVRASLGGFIILAGLIPLGVWAYIHHTKRQRALKFASLRAHAVDTMSGKEFEIFLKHLLTARGYSAKNVYHGNDGGVDLVAKIDDKIYSIQAKRYKNKKADRRAITDAVAGITYRKCTHAMAITNSYFTKAAIEYAKETNCTLIDRDILAKWVFELQENR